MSERHSIASLSIKKEANVNPLTKKENHSIRRKTIVSLSIEIVNPLIVSASLSIKKGKTSVPKNMNIEETSAVITMAR